MLLFSMDEWNNSQSSIEGILDGNRRVDKSKPEMQLQKAASRLINGVYQQHIRWQRFLLKVCPTL